LRTPADARVLRGPGTALLVTTEQAPAGRREALATTGAEVMVTAGAGSQVDLTATLRRLGERGIISVLVEGGAGVLGSVFDAGLADKVVAFLAPRILGGAGAPAAVAGAGVERLADARELSDVTVSRCGPDIVVTGYCQQ